MARFLAVAVLGASVPQLVCAAVCKGDEAACRAGPDEDASLLQVFGKQLQQRWSWEKCSSWINAIPRCLNATSQKIASALEHVTLFDDDSDEGFSGTSISDGEDDMYDDGNFLSVSGQGLGFSAPLPYTQQCSGTWNSTGHGDIEYFTCRMDTPQDEAGKSHTVWYAGLRSKSGIIDGLAVSGNMGSDGSGSTPQGQVGPSRGLSGYFAQTVETGDPSINHLLVVPSRTWIHNAMNPGMDTELDIITASPKRGLRVSRGGAVHALLYVLWGGGEGDDNIAYTPQDFSAVLDLVAAGC